VNPKTAYYRIADETISQGCAVCSPGSVIASVEASAVFWQVALPRPELRQPLRRSSCPWSRGARTLVGMDNARRYWYGAKRYPFGCRFPLTWEGWLVDAIWISSFIGISPLLRPDSQHSLQGLGLYFGLIAVFMAIRSWKGEPRWHD
jgi:hypothetical protein